MGLDALVVIGLGHLVLLGQPDDRVLVAAGVGPGLEQGQEGLLHGLDQAEFGRTDVGRGIVRVQGRLLVGTEQVEAREKRLGGLEFQAVGVLPAAGGAVGDDVALGRGQRFGDVSPGVGALEGIGDRAHRAEVGQGLAAGGRRAGKGRPDGLHLRIGRQGAGHAVAQGVGPAGGGLHRRHRRPRVAGGVRDAGKPGRFGGVALRHPVGVVAGRGPAAWSEQQAEAQRHGDQAAPWPRDGPSAVCSSSFPLPYPLRVRGPCQNAAGLDRPLSGA